MSGQPERPGIECWQVRVHGRVQGVGYREACVVQAMALGIVGWVRNHRDGSVEVMLQGNTEALVCMGDWLRRGPPAARVERVDVAKLEPPFPPFERFERRPSA